MVHGGPKNAPDELVNGIVAWGDPFDSGGNSFARKAECLDPDERSLDASIKVLVEWQVAEAAMRDRSLARVHYDSMRSERHGRRKQETIPE